MKGLLKGLVLSVGMAALLLGGMPQQSLCLMSAQSTVACKMACCHSAAGKAACPMIRTAVPQDTITPSASLHITVLKVVYAVAVKQLLVASQQIEFFPAHPDVGRSVFKLSPHVGPAPPSLA